MAALRGEANEAKLRLNTPEERLSDGKSLDARAVKLWAAVLAASRRCSWRRRR